MKLKPGHLLALCMLPAAVPAFAAPPERLAVTVDHVELGGTLPAKYTVCTAKTPGHIGWSQDINPEISWSPGPKGTESYAVFLEDPNVPAAHRDWVDQPDKTLPPSLKRRIFFHWVLVDIPASVTSIAEGEVANGLVPHGKPQSASPVGLPGENSFTTAFAANPTMQGTYYGYDGPCPPWNDEVVHHYIFKVYALSVPKLTLAPGFDGPAALAAMQDKILAQGALVTRYTTNPSL